MLNYQKAYIEISNICNLKCDFCPEVNREKKIMSVANFEKIVKQAAPISSRVCLHLMGEPLGHPHLQEILEICEKHNVLVELTTNGILLERKKNELNSKSILQINISIHSFEANFPEQSVSNYLDKVFSFTERSVELYPKRYINLRLWDLSEPRSMSVKNKKIHEYIESKFNFKFEDLKLDVRRKKTFKLINNISIHFDSRFEWPSLKREPIHRVGTCHALKHHFGVHADGTVVACCLDKEADLKLGNCIEGDLVQILKSKRAQKIRQGFDEGILVEDLCKTCDFIKRFSRKGVVKK